MSDTCKHWEGDNVNGLWVCAKCFAELAERPRKLIKAMKVPDFYADQPPKPTRQDVIIAPIAAHEGTTLAQFIAAMAQRLVARTRGAMSTSEAANYAIDLLQGFDEPFGSKDMAWDAGGAWEIVDEDLQHWDAEESATN